MAFAKACLAHRKPVRRLLHFGGLLLGFLPMVAGAQSVFDHPVPAGAFPPALKQLSKSLQDHRTLRSQFTQTKQIRILQHPLVTTGNLLFSPDHGVYWKTATPFEAEVVITPEGYFQRKNGQLVSQIPAGAGAGVQEYLNAFLLVFSGDFAKLDRLFALSFLQAPPSWTVGLTSKGSLAKAVKSIEISGKFPANLKRIVIREANGDLTRIELHDTESSTLRLSSAELRLFE